MDVISDPRFMLRAVLLLLGAACYSDVRKRYGWGAAGMASLILGGVILASA